MKRRYLVGLGALSTWCAGLVLEARATTLVVPDQYATIQQAIDVAAATGDVIQVRPGTYAEALVVDGKALAIEGLGGQPVIAPGPAAKGVLIRGDVNLRVTLQDLDIVGARIGVVSKVNDVYLLRVDITGCGTGAVLKSTHAAAEDCAITGNTGHGLKMSAATPGLLDVSVSANGAGGATIKHGPRNGIGGTAGVENSIFDGNAKTGLRVVTHGALHVLGCQANLNAGAGITITDKGTAIVDLENDQANDNGTYGFDLRSVSPTITEALLMSFGNTATGNGTQDFLIQPDL